MLRTERASLPVQALVMVVAIVLTWTRLTLAEEATDAIQAGEEAFSQERFDSALESFERAYRLNPMPALLYNIAMCQWELEQIPSAVNSFRRYLDEDTEISAQDREEVEQILTELRHLHGDVDISVNEAGIAVHVDGVQVGTSPLRFAVAVGPGEHTFSAQGDERTSETVTRSVDAGGNVAVSLTIEQGADEAPTVTATTPVDEEPPDEPQTSREPLPWWFWAPLGVTVATGVAAAVTGGLTLRLRDEYVASDQLDLDAYDRGTALGVSTDVLIGLAATAATISVIALVIHLVRDRRGRGESRGAGALVRGQPRRAQF